MLSDAARKAGNIDALINNAAVFHKDGLMAVTERKFMAELRVNFMAPAVLMREFARIVIDRSQKTGGAPSGKVVNLLDRRIAGAEAGCLPYLLSKKMLAEFTRSSALELAPYVTVNGVAPGAILPPPVKKGPGKPGKGRGVTAITRDLAGTIPLKRKCSVNDVAEAVIFLLESDGITGQVIYVDGGQHLLGSDVG